MFLKIAGKKVIVVFILFLTHIIPLVEKIKILNYFLRISNDFGVA